MTPEDLIERLDAMKVWKRDGERALQKPLLLLLALARVWRGKSRLQPYTEIEEKLTELLEQFSAPRQGYEPKHPFLRLVNDRLWEVPDVPQLSSREIDEMRRDVLRSQNIAGGLPEEIYDALRDDDDMLLCAVQFLLNKAFSKNCHRELLKAVGFGALDLTDPAFNAVNALKQNRKFRRRVIIAYEHRCAICDYDIRILDKLLGLEAAHIRWRSEDGPDEVPNGLALCTPHHHAFYRGGISVENDMKVLVSPQLHGREAAQIWFLEYEGKPIRSPRNRQDRPNPEYLDWHRREVFRKTAI